MNCAGIKTSNALSKHLNMILINFCSTHAAFVSIEQAERRKFKREVNRAASKYPWAKHFIGALRCTRLFSRIEFQGRAAAAALIGPQTDTPGRNMPAPAAAAAATATAAIAGCRDSGRGSCPAAAEQDARV